jgi:hypothetical protein
MKITKKQLKQIILEELAQGLEENISLDTPYGVVNIKTGEIVYKTTYKYRNKARAIADKKDLEYGGHNFAAKMLKTEELEEIQNKQNYAVGQATKKLQKAPGIETYLKQINNRVKLEQFIANVVKLTSDKISPQDIYAALTRTARKLQGEMR